MPVHDAPLPRSAEPAPIVGRDRELAAMDAFLAAPWPRLLLVEGPAGIGKTTLVDAAIRRTAGHGTAPLVARPTLAERDLPFAALASLLPDTRIEPVLAALAPPRRRALEVALRREPADGATLDAAALGLAVLDVLRAVARPVPVLVVVDDLQWCDEPTASALAFALRRAGSEPVAILGGVRAGVLSAAVEVVAGALPAALVDRLAVGPLSLGAVGRVLEQRTGRARARAVVGRIAEAAGGNPLLALELARAIDASGRDPAPGEPLAVPATAEPLISGRLALLPPAADDAVLVVALAGHAAVSEVRAATGDPGPALDEAIRAGLLELDGDTVRLGHPLVGAAAAGRATPERRRDVHRRLAAVLADPEVALRHRAMGADEPDESLAADLAVLADRAGARGAPAIAAELAELAAERTPPGHPTAAAERWRRVAEHRLAAGDLDRAGTAIAAGLALLPPGPARVPLLLVEVERAHAAAGRPAARVAADLAVTEAGDDPVPRAEAVASLLAFGTEDAREEEGLAGEVLALLAGREEAAPGAASNALAVLASARLAAGRGPAIELFERALALDRARPDFVIGSLEVYGGHLRAAGRVAASREAFGEVLERLAAAGAESRRVNALAHAAWTELVAGDHRAAAALLDASLALADELGADATGARIYRAHLGVLLGDPGARAEAEAGLAAAEEADATWVAALWHRVLGTADLIAGDPAGAARHLEVTLGAALDRGYREPAWTEVDANLCEALVAAGRLDDAERAVADFAVRAGGASLPWSAVTLARAEAQLRAARGDLEGALDALDAAVGTAATLEHPLEQARFELVRGTVLRRLRRVREARAVLETAAAAAAACPSPPWEARARAELARLGGRAAAMGDLTPAERRVAGLAAAGRSNREIADELVVSVRTVESQLSAVYGKLGVRGRAALARVLDDEGRATPGS